MTKKVVNKLVMNLLFKNRDFTELTLPRVTVVP